MTSHSEKLKKAKSKAARYCSLGERSPRQVLDKLISYGLDPDAAKSVLSELKTQQFVDEVRFSRAFANDKCRFNHWGRIKIRFELKYKHGLSDEVIETGLEYIDQNEYLRIINHLLEKKISTMSTDSSRSLKLRKSLNYLKNKGFETDLVLGAFDTFISGQRVDK